MDYVSLNNEPTCCDSVNYPSLITVTPATMDTMLKDYWFPAFEKNHIDTKILLLDYNWGAANLVDAAGSPIPRSATRPSLAASPGTATAVLSRPSKPNSTTAMASTMLRQSAPDSAPAASSSGKTCAIWSIYFATGAKLGLNGRLHRREPGAPCRWMRDLYRFRARPYQRFGAGTVEYDNRVLHAGPIHEVRTEWSGPHSV